MFKGADVKLIDDVISVGDKAPVATGTERGQHHFL